MNILDFLHKSGICESKSEAKRAIKSNRISVDCSKINNERLEIDIDDNVELINIVAGDWMCGDNFLSQDLVLLKLIKKFGLKNFKGIDEILDIVLKDIFIVENGKKNFFIVKER